MKVVLLLVALCGTVYAQPVPPPGLRKVATDTSLFGTGTTATPIGLMHCISTGQSLVWNNSTVAWECGTGSGITGTITTGDLIAATGTNTVGNFAGSTPAACAAGQVLTRVTSAATGAITLTCTAIGTAGGTTGTGTANTFTMWTGTTTVGNSPLVYDGSTTLSTSKAYLGGLVEATTPDTSEPGFRSLRHATAPGVPATDLQWGFGYDTTTASTKFRWDYFNGTSWTGPWLTLDSSGNVGMFGALDLGTHQIHNVVDPTSAQDAATQNSTTTAVNAAVTGTPNALSRFASAHVLGNANATDDLTTFTIASGTPSFSVTEATAKTLINSVATPADSQLTLKANSLGALSFLSFAADNQQINFDYERVGSSQLARNTSVGSFGKITGVFRWYGKTGATLNAAVTPIEIMDLDLGTGNLAPIGSYNCAPTTNGSAVCKHNAVGYSNGTTQFRDFEIDDGKGNQAVYVTGSTLGAEFKGAVTADTTLAVTGLVDLTGQSVYLGRQVFTASGTYTPTTGTRKVLVRECGAGGGGGGAKGGAAGGGAGGSFVEKWINPAATIAGGTVTIGTAGTAGAITPTNGGNGGDTAITIQTITYTAKGGLGSLASGSAGASPGGAGQSGSTAGDVSAVGMPGVLGVATTTSLGVSGNGGSSPLGTGGVGVAFNATNVTGISGSGYCAGGSGGAGNSGAAGGAGTAGVVIVDEYR